MVCILLVLGCLWLRVLYKCIFGQVLLLFVVLCVLTVRFEASETNRIPRLSFFPFFSFVLFIFLFLQIAQGKGAGPRTPFICFFFLFTVEAIWWMCPLCRFGRRFINMVLVCTVNNNAYGKIMVLVVVVVVVRSIGGFSNKRTKFKIALHA